MAGAHVRKRSSGGWEYYFDIATVDGVRKRKFKSGFKTKSEAMKAGAKAWTEFNERSESFTISEIGFNDYLNYWMEHYVKVNCIPSTYDNYEKKIRLYIRPALGDYKLKALSSSTIQNFINALYIQGLSKNTLAMVKSILSGCFSYAVEPCKYIPSSPMAYVNIPKATASNEVTSNSKEHIYVEPDIWKQIIERFPEGHPSHIPLMLGYHCGLRLSEVYGLMWHDVDLENKTLRIERQVDYEKGTRRIYFKAPKYKSYRTISIDDEIVALLKREQIRVEESKKELGVFYKRYYVDGHVSSQHFLDNGYLEEDGDIEAHMLLTRPDGTYIQRRTMCHTLRSIHGKANEYSKKKAKKPITPIAPAICEEFDFHSLRHTHGTMLLENGIPIPAIKDRLGHAKIEMTEHYVDHVTQRMTEMLNEKINDLYK